MPQSANHGMLTDFPKAKALPKSRWRVRTVACALANPPKAATAQSAELEYGVACAQGPRDDMEDAICVVPDLSNVLYAGVFDGHGGDAASLWLEKNMQKFLRPVLEEGQDPKEALPAAFQEADAELLHYLEQASTEGKALTGAGSTGTVALVTQDKIVTANIGDSSAVLMRNGKDMALTTAHRVYGTSEVAKAEIQRVKDAGGWVGDGRVCDVLAVSRAFGDWEFKGKGLPTLLSEGVQYEWWDQAFADAQHFSTDPVIPTPAVSVTEISEDQKDEFMVVSTDGLWDFYNQSEAMLFARTALRGGASAQDVADQLVERALKRYTSDNVAVAVVRFPWFKKEPRKKFSLF